RKTIDKLHKEREKTEARISSLEDEEVELNLTLPYLQDLVDSIGAIPELGQEFMDDVKEDIDHLEELIETTRKNIEANKGFLTEVETALEEATSLLNDYVKRLSEENPNIPLSVEALLSQVERFLGEEGARQYVEQRLGFTEATLELEEEISSFRDELNIPDLSKKAENLRQTIKDLESSLDELIAEQIAKAKVLDTFQKQAEAHRKQKEEEER